MDDVDRVLFVQMRRRTSDEEVQLDAAEACMCKQRQPACEETASMWSKRRHDFRHVIVSFHSVSLSVHS